MTSNITHSYFLDLADIDAVPRTIARDVILDKFKQAQSEQKVRAVKQRCAVEKQGQVDLPSVSNSFARKLIVVLPA